jgi:hypothetical protein
MQTGHHRRAQERTSLSRDKVLRSALTLADRDGTGALSIRPPAQDMGTRPMLSQDGTGNQIQSIPFCRNADNRSRREKTYDQHPGAVRSGALVFSRGESRPGSGAAVRPDLRLALLPESPGGSGKGGSALPGRTLTSRVQRPALPLPPFMGKNMHNGPWCRTAAGAEHQPEQPVSGPFDTESIMGLPEPGSARNSDDSGPVLSGPDRQDSVLVDTEAAQDGACARIQITTSRVCALRHPHTGSCRFTDTAQAQEEPDQHNAPDPGSVPQAWDEGDADSADRPW